MNTLVHSLNPTAVLAAHPFFSDATQYPEIHQGLADVQAQRNPQFTESVWVEFKDGIPQRAGKADTWKDLDLDCEIIEGSHYGLTLPLTDIHCHGGGGFSYEDPGSFPGALQVHRSAGTGRAIATLVTNPIEELITHCKRIAHAIDTGEGIPEHMHVEGIHLEGPWLDAGHKGAHEPKYLHPASLDEVKQVIDAAEGHVRQVTLAPELDEDLRVTKYLVEQGITVAVGHTNATYEQARAAFDAGASLLTHAFNAMNGIHHRAPGPVVAAMDSYHVYLELIADGIHVKPSVMDMLFRAAPDRVVLVTDAMAAAGQPDGQYKLGSLDVAVIDGTAKILNPDGSLGAIAGSTLTLRRALEVLDATTSVGLNQSLYAATLQPAKALGLAPIADKQLLILDGSLQPVAVD